MLTERERGVDPLLADEPAFLIEPWRRDLRVTLERDVGERIAAPEGEGLIVRAQRRKRAVEWPAAAGNAPVSCVNWRASNASPADSSM